MKRRIPRLIVVFLGLLLVAWLGCRLIGEILWFQELGYLSAYWLRLQSKVVIWAIASSASLFFLLSNLNLAQQLKHRRLQISASQRAGKVSDRIRETGVWNFQRRPSAKSSVDFSPPTSYFLSLPFRWLLPLALGLSLFLGLLTLHYSQVVWKLWLLPLEQPGTLPSIPDRFRPEAVWEMIRNLIFPSDFPFIPFLGMGLLILGAIALLIYPSILLRVIAVTLSVALGAVLSANWGKILQFFHPTSFNQTDPLFSRDISFYIFSLPFWILLEFWLAGLLLYGLAAVTLTYLLSGDSLSQGRFIGFSPVQRRHLCGLGGGLMLVVALSYWVSRYELLYSPRGVVYGASYTDVRVVLPAYMILSLLAVAIALFLFWQAFWGVPKNGSKVAANGFRLTGTQKVRPYTLVLLCGYAALVVIAGSLVPDIVQRIIVQPNELAQERPFIQHNIAFTREAFDLESIDVQTFNPQGTLTYTALQENDLTVRNIRLWDTRPLLQTNRQLQQIRLYYRFYDADIDRYAFDSKEAIAPSLASPIPSENQQVLISARELDYSAVPQIAQTWVNEHLVYTHGYGFTLSPVNQVAEGGLPYYFVKDIGTGAGTADAGALNTSSPLIRERIPIYHPRIYYGELTNTYIMTGTRVQELDYPSGNENVYNVYDGSGGVNIGPLWRRWLFAVYLKDWQMVLTNNFTPQTKLLFRRNINQRIRAIAPFLTYDRDPYLVVADVEGTWEKGQEKRTNSKAPGSITPNYLYWIVDAYTSSDRYPYSDPTQVPGVSSFNYIRNSVKVVIDAYNGSVNFYVADPRDPIIQTWSAIFPNLFKPLDDMPAVLRSHIRYPIDLFTAQSERLMTYHMTDPQVFYNREDQWQIPTEIYGNQPQSVEPYYLIMKLPFEATEEFIQLLPFTPRARTNLAGWLAARSDGENYGKSLLYVFPKEQLVFGIEQIEARINQDPVISQQISLWNRQGSQAIQGNLLVIPINQSLLYVEPLYLEATQNSLPTLARVIVAYENRIVMAETLEQSLRAIFDPAQPTTPAIVRPVEQLDEN
ncbi:MAG: UPF0182 family protein [Leptolyngbyaceae cyanobacterium HOT.MB2.61]|nr:UPF0182 family protein [Leptolyngbyaceae cyanobacterium HOT.MB2.61]